MDKANIAIRLRAMAVNIEVIRGMSAEDAHDALQRFALSYASQLRTLAQEVVNLPGPPKDKKKSGEQYREHFPPEWRG